MFKNLNNLIFFNINFNFECVYTACVSVSVCVGRSEDIGLCFVDVVEMFLLKLFDFV